MSIQFNVALFSILVTRGLAALGMMAFSIIVSRQGGAILLGQTATYLGMLFIGVVLAKRGLDVLLLKVVAQQFDATTNQNLTPYLISVIKQSVLPALCIGGIITLIEMNGILGEIEGVNFTGIILVPVMVFLAAIAAYIKGLGKAWAAPLFESGSVAAGAIVFLTIFGLSPIPAFMWSALCLSVVAIIYMFLEQSKGGKISMPSNDLNWCKGKLDFSVIGLATVLIASGSFALGALFIPADELGLLRGAERLALIISFPVLAIDPFISPMIARAAHQKRPNDLRKVTGYAIIAGSAVGIIPFLFLLVFPKIALSLLGTGFESAVGYLRIMACVQLSVVILSPFVMLLNFAGGERVSMKISMLTLVLAFIGIPMFSYLGAGPGFLFVYCGVVFGKLFISLWQTRKILKAIEN